MQKCEIILNYNLIIKKGGSPYGTHRVISPKGVLPQPADKIDNDMEIWDNEVLIDVKTLNIDSASFTEIVRRVLDKKPAEVTTKEEMEHFLYADRSSFYDCHLLDGLDSGI